LYKIFDVFVHVPVDEFVENFGYVYVESMAAGVPSIFSLSGVVTGMVQHMEHCYVVPHGNSDEIYAGLRTLIDDPPRARRMAESAKAILPAELRPEIHVRALEKIYSAA
jgi:glycosyltransferase involved in cell wall biosynthesis